MNLKGKRIAIFVDQLYQEMEVWYPYFRLIEAGAEVHLVAAEAGKSYPSKLGYPCTSHKSYADLKSSDYDGVIAPGGFAPDFIRRHPASSQFIAQIDSQGKLVAAICHGLWCLCSANVLKGKRCTSYMSIVDDVRNAGKGLQGNLHGRPSRALSLTKVSLCGTLPPEGENSRKEMFILLDL